MISRRLAVGLMGLAGCVIVASTSGATSGRTDVARLDGSDSAVDVAFAGRDVLYARINAPHPAVYSVADGLLYEAPEVPVPPRFKKRSLYESKISQSISSLAGGPGVVAFVRSVIVVHTPKCRPSCALPSYMTRVFSEVRARFGSATFRRVAGGPGHCPAGQFWPDEVAVVGQRIVYSGRLDGCKGRRQESRVVIGRTTGGLVARAVVARFLRTGYVRVAAAGRFVAWSRDWGRSRRPDRHNAELFVYDRARAKVAYTVGVPRRPRINGVSSIAVQNDGTVAALITRDVGTCELPQLVWAIPSPVPRLRVLGERPDVGFSSDVKLAGNRVMFVRSSDTGCSFSAYSSDLVVRDLNSSAVRVLGHYELGQRPETYPGPTIDFDGAQTLFSENVLVREDPSKGWTTIFVDEVP